MTLFWKLFPRSINSDSSPGKQTNLGVHRRKREALHTLEQVQLLNLEFYIPWNSVSQSERSHFFEIEG